MSKTDQPVQVSEIDKLVYVSPIYWQTCLHESSYFLNALHFFFLVRVFSQTGSLLSSNYKLIQMSEIGKAVQMSQIDKVVQMSQFGKLVQKSKTDKPA